MSVAIVIPARLGSTRLPRKLLADLCGKTIIQRTYEQALKARKADIVVIATDSPEIAQAASAFGARAMMTRADHQSGSDRVAEAAALIDAETIINIQGDEPEIDPAHIDQLIEAHQRAGMFAATLGCSFPATIDPAYPAAVKVFKGEAIDAARDLFIARDFSRTPPPGATAEGLFLHIGAYAFSRETLLKFVAAPKGRREALESLEQLRIIEMGEAIALRLVDKAARGIDTLEDLAAARKRLCGADEPHSSTPRSNGLR